MPKRKMTAKRIAQIEKWRIAGALSHHGKPSPRMWDGTKVAPMGKMATMFHRTTSYNARAIVNTRNWKPKSSSGLVFLSHGGVTPEEHIRGNSVVSVKVPRRKLTKEFNLINGISYYMAHKNDLRGRKVRRVR